MALRIKELREKQARLATEARAKYDEITDTTPAERAEEINRAFDAIMADHDAITPQIERLERLEAAEARAAGGDPRRPRGQNGEDRGAGREAGGDDPEARAALYREAFTKAVRFGAVALSDVEARSLRGQYESLDPGQIPAEVRAQATAAGTAGGYTVPTGFVPELEKALAMWGPMWDGALVREMPTASGNPLPWPTVDDTSRSGAQLGESTAAPDTGAGDVEFGQKVLNAYMYTTDIVKVPIQLLQDSAFSMEAQLQDLFSERLGRKANAVLTTGTGSAQPQGIVTGSSLGKTAASATAFTADELIDLFHSVDPAYRQSPKFRWMFNDATLATIRKLKDGQGNYLWSVGDVRASEPEAILGKPFSINQAMATVGASAKSVLVGDFSKFVVRKVIDFSVMTLRERYAEYFQVGMIGYKRFDSRVLQPAAIRHLAHPAS